MKYVIVHSGNSGLVGHLQLFPDETQLMFNSDLNDNDDVDLYIRDFIQLYKKDINGSKGVFIKYALTPNYGELIGLRLAHYIRLTNELLNGKTIPIIFVGDESPIQILKLSYLGNILATPGVYYVREDLEAVEKVLNRINDDTLKGLVTFDDYI